MLKEVEQTGLGIQLSSGKTVGGMLFADDFVGISGSKESLQKLLDVVYSYCSKWRLRANVSKSAVMVFSKDAVNGCWKWGEYSRPIVSSYSSRRACAARVTVLGLSFCLSVCYLIFCCYAQQDGQ